MRLSSLSVAAIFIVVVSVGAVQAETNSVLAKSQGQQYEVTPVGVMMRFNDAVFGRATTSNSACGCEAKPSCDAKPSCGCDTKPVCGCTSKPTCDAGCTTRPTYCKPQCRTPLLDSIAAKLNLSLNSILPCNKCKKSCGCGSKGCTFGGCDSTRRSGGCCTSGGQVVPAADNYGGESDPFTDDPEPPVVPPVTEARLYQSPFGNGVRQPAARTIGDLQVRNVEPRQPMKEMTMRYATVSRTRSSIPKPGASFSRRKTSEVTSPSPSDRETSNVRPAASQQQVPFSYGNPLR